MAKNPRKGQAYRYAPAFILLFLAGENLYGAALYNKMQSQIPHCHADGAVIYRTLQDLEEEGAVRSYWETSTPGPARKWYQITERGLERLAEFKEDIENRKKNFEFFLDSFSKMGRPLDRE
jgi:DNA-binding PadR family transcriptional regulator